MIPLLLTVLSQISSLFILAIHTFPEDEKTYIELSSCNENKNDRFIQLLNESPIL